MRDNLQNLDIQDLQVLLINKNKEFTEAMKMGRKHAELVPIYEGIKEIYNAIVLQKKGFRLAKAS